MVRGERLAVGVTVAAGIAGAGVRLFLAPAALVAVAIDGSLLRRYGNSKTVWAAFVVALALLAYGATVFSFGE